MIAVLGIDPGVNGGIAVLDSTGKVLYLQGLHSDGTHAGLVAVVKTGLHVLAATDSRLVFIEKVGYIGKRPGGRKDGGKGAFTFGRVDGLIRGGVLMAGYRPIDVYPMIWQAEMNCLTHGDKNISKRRAQELWPQEKWTHATADAALIAEYGRRKMAL